MKKKSLFIFIMLFGIFLFPNIVSAEEGKITSLDFTLIHNSDGSYTVKDVDVPEGKKLYANALKSETVEILGGKESAQNFIKTGMEEILYTDISLGESLDSLTYENIDITENRTFSFSNNTNPDVAIILTIVYAEYVNPYDINNFIEYRFSSIGLANNVSIGEDAYNILGTKVDVTGIKLDKNSLTLTVDDKDNLVKTISPINASDKRVIWSSSDNSIVSVDADGNIKAISVGTATITAITKDGNKIATCEVKVKPNYTYTFLEGDNQKFILNKIENYTFRIDGDYELFDKLVIGETELVKDTDYKIIEGSTIITFTEAGITKLNALGAKEYDIKVLYTNGKQANGKLIINEPEKQPEPEKEPEKVIPPSSPKTEEEIENPKTFDGIMTWIILSVVSVIGFVGAIKFRKKLYNK